jgi:hypothetical protein
MFAAALRSKRFPQNVQTALCGAYSESRFYWGAITLFFRLAMSIVFATIRDFPSTAALTQCFFCSTMLVLLVYMKPHHHEPTNFFDIMCHAILTIQFALVAIGTVSESLGFTPSDSNLYFGSLSRTAQANMYLRCVSRLTLPRVLRMFCIFSRYDIGSYIPFVMGAVLWLYLHRTAISDRASLSYRSLKSFSIVFFRRCMRWSATDLALGSAENKLCGVELGKCDRTGPENGCEDANL